MEREEELEQTIDELNYRLTNALKKLDRLKSSINQAREEIENLETQIQSYHNDDLLISQSDVLAILDNLIAESEGE